MGGRDQGTREEGWVENRGAARNLHLVDQDQALGWSIAAAKGRLDGNSGQEGGSCRRSGRRNSWDALKCSVLRVQYSTGRERGRRIKRQKKNKKELKEARGSSFLADSSLSRRVSLDGTRPEQGPLHGTCHRCRQQAKPLMRWSPGTSRRYTRWHTLTTDKTRVPARRSRRVHV